MNNNTTFSTNPGQNIVSIGFKQIGPYYWVGRCSNGIDYYAGQTFQSPVSGLLQCIRLFPTVVYGSTEAYLEVYEFDKASHTWKNKKAEVKTTVTKTMEGNWIEFAIPGIEVRNGEHYGFKLVCKGSGMVAIAERPWNTSQPHREGEEWIGSSLQTEGNFHEDFDLAYQADITA